MRVSRILHAGYLFESGGAHIAFDPVFENPFSRNGHAFPNVRFDLEAVRRLKLDAVFLSHFHDDHCSLESLALLDRGTPIRLYCLHDELFGWIRELGFRDVRPLELDEPVRVGPFEVIPRRAYDADVDSMLEIRAGGLRVLNVVDAMIDESTLGDLRGPWDMVLWPFQTMREIAVLVPSRAEPASRGLPPEWIEQLRVLRPRFVVPSSCQFAFEEWSWMNRAFFPITYRRFASEVESAVPGARVVRMNPSVSVVLERDSLRPADPLPWVIPVGEQDVDYDFDADAAPSPTADIARRFPALSAGQTAAIRDYCRSGLIRRHEELGPSADPYFRQRRRWRLSLFDHRGEAEHFHYDLDEGRLVGAEGERPLAWTTEIPIAKLHAALHEGEALTSLFVRINDSVFDPGIEREVADADVLEDPLVRALFTGVFGSYQRAQLRRLLGQRN